MIKKLMIQIFVLVSFVSAASAAPAKSVIQLKDVSYKFVGANTLEVTAGDQKVKLEKVGDTSFKINGQPVAWDKNETMEQLQSKIEKAYIASQKKGAMLESVLLPKAHAFMAMIMTALLGGVLGFMLGKSACAPSMAPASATGGMPEVAPVNTFSQ